MCYNYAIINCFFIWYKMAGVSKLLDDKTYDLAKSGLENMGQFGNLAVKLKAITACKEHSISEVAEIFQISRISLTNWIKAIKNGDLDELFIKEGRGRSCLVNESHHATIKSWIENSPNLTIENIQMKICNELNIKIGRTATYNLIKKLNLSYITPRPTHHKANIEAQESFKKASMS